MEAAVRWTSAPQRAHDRRRVGQPRPSLIVEGPDLARPLLARQPTDLLEPAPEQRCGRIVEENS
jgi:hypothetical protein